MSHDIAAIWQYCKSMATVRPIYNYTVIMMAVLDEIQKVTICLFIFVSCPVRVCSTHLTLTVLSYPYQCLQSSQFS